MTVHEIEVKANVTKTEGHVFWNFVEHKEKNGWVDMRPKDSATWHINEEGRIVFGYIDSYSNETVAILRMAVSRELQKQTASKTINDIIAKSDVSLETYKRFRNDESSKAKYWAERCTCEVLAHNNTKALEHANRYQEHVKRMQDLEDKILAINEKLTEPITIHAS